MELNEFKKTVGNWIASQLWGKYLPDVKKEEVVADAMLHFLTEACLVFDSKEEAQSCLESVFDESVKIPKVVELSCNHCGKEFSKEKNICEGYGKTRIEFGYGSVFESETFKLKICDTCLLKLFYPALKELYKDDEKKSVLLKAEYNRYIAEKEHKYD